MNRVKRDVFTQIYQRVAVKKKGFSDELEKALCQGYGELSYFLERVSIQDAGAVRSQIRARHLARILIDERGMLIEEELERASLLLEKHLYHYGIGMEFDAPRQEHMLRVLTFLQKEPSLRKALCSLPLPQGNPFVEKYIRQAIHLPNALSLHVAHARQAVLAAWLTLLRQNVGSCFATAPAILIQRQQPERFLADMRQILLTGLLKRTVEGREYVVPVSQSSGSGDFRKPFLVEKSTPLWMNPGLIAAFEAAELIPKRKNLRQRSAATKALLQRSYFSFPREKEVWITNAEEVLCTTLAIEKKTSLEQLKTLLFERQEKKEAVFSLFHTAPSRGSKEEKELFHHYLFAKEAFLRLSENPLLKAWEYTLASFSESKLHFARWNLYSSLGLELGQKYGIASCLHEVLQEKLDLWNERVKRLEEGYEQLYGEVRFLEGRVNRAVDERQAKNLAVECQRRVRDLNALVEHRDKAHLKARRIAHLFQELLDFYYDQFCHYFQEVYDAELNDLPQSDYDDRPAGFRLLYKHGRSHPSQWSFIYGEEEYIQALANFFTLTESVLTHHEGFQGLEEELRTCINKVLELVRTPEFLQSALERMSAARGSSLEKGDTLPWAYNSGGTMDTLLSVYYNRSEKPVLTSKWVESAEELLAFLLETLRKLPLAAAQEYASFPHHSLIMVSPTHVFTCFPGLPLLYQGWQEKVYPYTWIKQSLVGPAQEQLEKIYIEEESAKRLIECLAKSLPPSLRESFCFAFRELPQHMTAPVFRNHVLDQLHRDRRFHYQGNTFLDAEEIDRLLYASLPFTHEEQLREALFQVFENLGEEEGAYKRIIEGTLSEVYREKSYPSVFESSLVREIALCILMQMRGGSGTEDLYLRTTETMRKLRLSLAAPLLFADSNWNKDFFGFVVNPGTGKLDFWRFDYAGSRGSPMTCWKEWLDGSQKHPPWGIYNHPQEYQ